MREVKTVAEVVALPDALGQNSAEMLENSVLSRLWVHP